jgi:multiple sugar transport system substrate-binding protein
MWGIMQKAKPEIREHLKVAVPPFEPPTGGSSNVLGIASEIDDEEKKLVWDFIEIATSAEFQSTYAEISGSPAPRPGAIPADITAKVPHFDLLLQTMKEASAANVDRIPTGYETQFNEFSKMIQEEVQRMLVDNLEPADTAKRMQERAVAMK